MSRIARFAVLVAALMSLFAVMSSAAGAVTWHNTGDTAFTASNANAGTLSVTGVNLTCTGASATGTSPAGSTVGTTFTGATGTATFNGCSLSGLPTAVSCSYSLTTSAAATSGTPSVFHGNADALCSVTQFGTEICKVEGLTSGSYTNPVSASSTAGRLTLNHSSTLRTTNGSGGSCILGVGEPATLTAQTFTVTAGTGGPTPHLGPFITRTA
jgi:hypothetical protein